MKVKTSELIGAALDWAVAKCECNRVEYPLNKYSTDWAQGGPIIEREELTLYKRTGSAVPEKERFQAVCGHNVIYHQGKRGPSMLIAAMRCLVASKMGDVVSVPGKIL